MVRNEGKAFYLRANKLKESSSRPCAMRLLGKLCSKNCVNCSPPGTDHPSLLLKDGNAVKFISQPYGLEYETIKEMIDYCETNGLKFNIRGDFNWHCPGKAFGVIFESQ